MTMRNVLGAIAGLVAAVVCFIGMQLVAHAFYPMPDNLFEAFKTGRALTTVENAQLAVHIAAAPVHVMGIVLAGYAIGSFAAGFVISKIAIAGKIMTLIAGGLLTAMGVVNLMTLPHPMWFAVLSTAAYIPMALLGAKLGGGTKKG